MKKLLIVPFILITGCVNNTKPVVVTENERVCVPITDISQVLPAFVIDEDTDRRVKFTLPVDVPIDVDTKFKTDREIIKLSQTFGQDVIAINSILYAAVMLKNSAPCDEKNTEGSWEFMNKALKTLEKVYGGRE